MTEQSTGVVEYSPTEKALAELRQKYAAVVFDVTNAKGMMAAKEARRELRTLRTSLESMRVEIKAPALERCRLIDAEAKRITAELEKLEDPIAAAIKAEEDRKEAERAEKALQAEAAARALRAKLDAIRNRPLSVIGKPAPTIAALIDDTKALEFSDLNEQYQAEAIKLRDEAIEKLVVMHSDRVSADAEQARLAVERAELERQRAAHEAAQKESDRTAREEREAQEAAARAERERQDKERQAEHERQQAELKTERERLAEVERQQQAAAAAERQRLADEEAERQRQAQAERDRLDAERKEFERQQAEAARIERERQEAAQRESERQRREAEEIERQNAIDSADLIQSAGEAVQLLQNEGFGEHLTTLKLAAALEREAAKHPLQEAA
jgi:hypothetical protein